MARTFCRYKFGFAIAVRSPSRKSRCGSDHAFGEGGTEGRGHGCARLDVACTLVAVSVETAQGSWNKSKESEGSVHDDCCQALCWLSGKKILD